MTNNELDRDMEDIVKKEVRPVIGGSAQIYLEGLNAEAERTVSDLEKAKQLFVQEFKARINLIDTFIAEVQGRKIGIQESIRDYLEVLDNYISDRLPIEEREEYRANVPEFLRNRETDYYGKRNRQAYQAQEERAKETDSPGKSSTKEPKKI